MKFYYIFLILCLSFGFVNAQFFHSASTPKFEEYKPYKGLKKCEKYKLIGNKDSKPEYLMQVWEYNKYGQPHLDVLFIETMDTVQKITYIYDKNNRLIRSLEYAPDYSLDEVTTEYSYNSKGLLEMSKTIKLDPTFVTYSYDANGSIKESRSYQLVPAYDENGNESEVIQYDIYKKDFKVDQNGRVTECNLISLSLNHDFSSTSLYTYNQKGQVVNFKILDKDAKVKHDETFSFDKSGKVKTSIVNKIDLKGIYNTTYFIYKYK